MQTTIIFTRAATARRVRRRLADHSILSFVVGKQVHIEVPRSMYADEVWEKAKQLGQESGHIASGQEQ